MSNNKNTVTYVPNVIYLVYWRTSMCNGNCDYDCLSCPFMTEEMKDIIRWALS